MIAVAGIVLAYIAATATQNIHTEVAHANPSAGTIGFTTKPPQIGPLSPSFSDSDEALRILAAKWASQKPTMWGTGIPGVLTHFTPNGKEIALTFDACRGAFDDSMLAVLDRENVPATVFVAGPWLRENPIAAHKLAQDPLIEIENHGAEHRPLSVTGRSAFRLQGTTSALGVIHEIEDNARAIEALTGRKPTLVRPATGYCDDVAVQIANQLNCRLVTFDVIGDEGATLTGSRMVAAIMHATPGSIVIVHINHPRPGAAEALDTAIRKLRENGFSFVHLENQKPTAGSRDNRLITRRQ